MTCGSKKKELNGPKEELIEQDPNEIEYFANDRVNGMCFVYVAGLGFRRNKTRIRWAGKKEGKRRRESKKEVDRQKGKRI